jgi:hypothetical protein
MARVGRTRQYQAALDLIQPTPELRAECKYEIVRAILLTRVGRGLDKSQPGADKRALLKQAKKLRAVEIAGVLWNESLIDRVKRERIFIEKYAASIVVRHGSRPWSKGRVNAVHLAECLLARFQGGRPALSIGGDWHRLAKILLGPPDSDLFDYMREHRSPGRRRR